MDSLSKKIQNLGMHDLRNAGRFMQNMIVQYEPYQIDVRRASNTDAWGPTSKHLQKVLRHKYSVPLYLITEYTLKRLIDHIATNSKNVYEKARKEYVNFGSEWRVVFKCLVILDFLLLNVNDGDELQQITSCLKKHKHILNKETMNYKIQFSNDGKMEIHEQSIRTKCEVILSYLSEPEILNVERLKHKKNQMKIQRSNESAIMTNNINFDTNEIANNIANNNLEVEDSNDDEDEELQARVNYEHRRHTSTKIDEERRKRRELLKERIKNNEEQRRKLSQSSMSANEVPDLLDFGDFDTTVSNSTNNNDFVDNLSNKEVNKDDDDEFGEFQSEMIMNNTTLKIEDNKNNEDLLSGLSNDNAPEADTASVKKNDVFMDLFTNSKSLI
ncbi:hypothetical protein TPHA_0C00740 [Tetrapisispora phaffii CBS 4417]|uniref:ENTH domain-containing protein n=1 Tax=Tetrapisispora phaffii (strain ATCC 24235 / CBS 4417 / NBRC 1672 / NRRL Y-8282 / UCD 70-5) TaxID=1071381 RepID=G8BR54_TETPH|nr:hypothetical protein TPHA_0C00740 [Tetrapisispora phaffii CBS 4417]CCE62230.1 hypothetical protein TPHA_0C00740 [Tetrapisispora phaffii CBS 4417]